MNVKDNNEIFGSLGFIFEWMEGQLKQSELRKMPKRLLDALFQSIVEPPDWFVEEIAVGEEIFDRIHHLVNKSFSDKKIHEKLITIYDQQKLESLDRIEQLIQQFEKQAYGLNKANQIYSLRKIPERRETLKKVEQQARQAAEKNPKRLQALQNLYRLSASKTLLERQPIPFSEIDFERKIAGKEPILGVSYKIWKPDFIHSLFQYEDEYQKFPLKWLGFKMEAWLYHRLYLRWKKGEDLSKLLETFYDGKDSFETIRKKCKSNHIGVRRLQIIDELIKNYEDQRYASTVALALTQIEGVIWDLAITLNNIGAERIFERNKVGFDESRSLRLIDKKGNRVQAETTVGLLVRCTNVDKYIYAPFLDYCTDELFRERNPILHGRRTRFGTKLEANKKLLALEMVISSLHKMLVDKAEIFLQHVLGGHFKEFRKNLQEGKQKEAFDLLRKVIITRPQSGT